MPDQIVINPVNRFPPIEVDWLVGDLASGGEPETRLDNSRLRSTVFDKVLLSRILPDGPDTVLIGVTRLSVPPTSIQVTNVSGSEPMSTLRSTTSALVKSGRARIQIDLSVIFPTVDDMNNQLRELVAQFRLAPFLPLRSTYVSNLLVSSVLPGAPDQSDSTSQQEQIQSIRNRIAKTSKELEGDLKTLFALLQPTGDEAEEAKKALFGGGSISGSDTAAGSSFGLLTALDALAKHGQYREVDDEFNKTIGIWLKTVGSLQKLRNLTSVIQKGRNSGWFTDYLLEVFGRVLSAYTQIDGDHLAFSALLTVPTVNTGTQSRHEPGTIVPVVLHSLSVSTIEGYPDSVMVRLSMMYFNYRPYSRFFEYRDEKGRPVADIQDSIPFREYLTSVLESPPLLGDTGTVRRQFKVISPSHRGHLGFRYPTTTLRQAPATSRDVKKKDHVEIDQSGSKHFAGKFTTPLIRDGDIGYVNEYRDWLIPPNDRNIVIESVQINLANRVATQPILGSIYPTAQYVGGMNANIVLGLCVQGVDRREHDEALNKLLAMKREIERVCVLYGPRARRDSKIFIANDLINLIGVQAVQLNDVIIETDGPFKSKVMIGLTEYTAAQSVRENLRKDGDNGLANQFRIAVQWATPKTRNGGGVAWLAQIDPSRIGFLQSMIATVINSRDADITKLVYGQLLAVLRQAREPAGLPFGSRDSRRQVGTRLTSLALQSGDQAMLRSLLRVSEIASNRFNPADAEIAGYELVGPTARREFEALLAELDQTATVIGLSRLDNQSVLDQLTRNRELARAIREMLDSAFWDRSLFLGIRNILQTRLPAGIPDNLKQTPVHQIFANVGASLVTRSLLYTALLKSNLYTQLKQGQARALTLEEISRRIEYYADYLIASSTGLANTSLFSLPDGVLWLIQTNRLPSSCDDPVILDALVEVVRELSEGSIQIPEDRAILLPELLRPRQPDLQSLYTALYTLRNRFPDLAALLNQKAPSVTTYPDLYLPTYGEVYRTVISRLKEDGKLQEGTSLGRQPTEVQDALRHIIPTYSDLGVPPPAGVDRTAFARELEEQVEPGFFWYHERTLDIENKPTNVSTPTSGPTRAPAGLAIAEDHYRRAARQAIQATAVVDVQAAKEAAEVASQSFEAALQTFRDDAWSMSRAFPTFKLYFVEPKSLALNLIDDLYGYNSVLSIKLHRHKFYPDTLEIDLLNISGNLDEQTLPEDQIEHDIRGLSSRAGVQGLLSRSRAGEELAKLRSEVASVTRRGTRDPITGKQASLDSLFLREGTMMVLKMGYSSKAEELETVFTGQVAEMQRGDVIQIVAQSYAVELTLPCHQKNSQGASNTVGLALQKDAAVHFGAVVPEALLAAESPSKRKSLEKQNVIDPLLINTRRLDNVYFSNDTGGGQNTWAVPGIMGLELIQEVTRYFPGFVAGVRPYDNHATLFIGSPHQTYRYTDTGIDQELIQKAELSTASNGWRQTYRARTPSRIQLELAVRQALLNFRGSKQFTEWKAGPFNNFLSAAFRTIDFTARTEINSDLDYGQYLDVLFIQLGQSGTYQVLEQLLNEIDPLMETGSRRRLEQDDVPVDEQLLRAGNNGYRFDHTIGEQLLRAGSDGYPFDQTLGRLTTAAGKLAEDSANALDRAATAFGNALNWLFTGKSEVYKSGAFDLGTIVTNIPDFEPLLRRLLGPLHANEDKIYETILANGSGAPLTLQGQPIRDWQTYARKTARFANALREFIRQFADWLQLGGSVSNVIAKSKLVEELDRKIFIGRKPFRAYHWVDSDRHIMKNSVRPSTDRMANEVQVRYPANEPNVDGDKDQIQFSGSQNWKLETIPYHPGIREWDIKSTIVAEMNAKNPQRARLTGISTLADAIAGMYVGELVIQGNERIQPYDVVWMFDFYNMVFGPIEVEAVTHVLLSDTGFASIITPMALTFASPTDFSFDEKQCLTQAELLISYVGSVNVKAPDSLLRLESSTDKVSAEQNKIASIRLVPLTHNGRPWVAGLRGLDPNWRMLTVDGRWDYVDQGNAAVVRSRIYGETSR